MNYEQILNVVNLGVVVFDREYKVCYWNRWMAMHSNIQSQTIINRPIFDFFPDLNNPIFMRNCRSVLTFGNLIFLSQKLHKYLFPFKLIRSGISPMEYMQQSCTMGPLRDSENVINYVFITIQDVTEIVSYEQRLRELNMTDGLTGMYNRRYLDIRINEEFKRHQRFGRPMSLILFDIDHFKKINDTYGHQCGDYILQDLSSATLSAIRNVDILARYGGEEFCCLLPETSSDKSVLIAERLRKQVMENSFRWNDADVHVTISLGVSVLTAGIDSPGALIERADQALYQAKDNGRNRVMLFDGGSYSEKPTLKTGIHEPENQTSAD